MYVRLETTRILVLGYEGLSGRMKIRMCGEETSMDRGECPYDFQCIAAKCALISYDYDYDDDNNLMMAISSKYNVC